jgi:hypothetical protein
MRVSVLTLRLCVVFGSGLSNVCEGWRSSRREEAGKQLVNVLLDVCQWRLVAATHLQLRSISDPSPDSGVACPKGQICNPNLQ